MVVHAGGRADEARRNDKAVLEAARRLIARRGVDASVAEIAAEAGVGVGSLYRRYPSKDALIEALCTHAMREWLEASTTALQTDDPWEGLAKFIRAAVEFRAGVFEHVAGSFQPTREMMALADKGQARLEKLLDRAQQAGAARPDVVAMDIRALISLFSRRTDDSHHRLVEIALRGLQYVEHAHLLDHPPAPWHQSVQRWSQ